MSGIDTVDGRRREDGTRGRTFDLRGVVVAYEDGPDRCTIYPHRLSPRERTTVWLTADASAFVALERIR